MVKSAFNIDLKKKTKNIKNSVKSINNTTFAWTEELVDGAISSSTKWQKIMAKAMNSGVILLGNQQEMALDAIESLKDQYQYGAKRVKKLVSLTPELKKMAPSIDLPTKKEIKNKGARTATKIKQTIAQKKTAIKKTSTSQTVISKKEMNKTDDLTEIDGVGKRIAALLNEAGIYSFNQLANSGLGTLRSILKNAGPSYQKHNPTPWRKEAKMRITSK